MEITAEINLGYLIGAIFASFAWIGALGLGFFIALMSVAGTFAGLSGNTIIEKITGVVSIIVLFGCIALFWWTATWVIYLWSVGIGG